VKVENLDIPERIKEDYIDSGITELNPPQKKAVEAGLMEEEDMIVAAPTASGKTFIAELAMVNQAVKQGKKAVYIVPLKALASEKYNDFSERYEELDVMMSVGDKDESGDYLETADIVIVTSEKLDSMLRHNPSWIHEIGLVVTDEIHLLTSPERGPTLEVTLTRLRDILDFQLLGLSATISNSDEMADWLDAELVESNYRPVELKEGIMNGNEVEYYPEDYENNEEKSEDSDPTAFKKGSAIKEDDGPENTETIHIDDIHGRGALNLLEDTLQKEKQAIVFCSSRKGAEKSSDRCTTVAEEDLSREERKELKDYAERIENVLGNPTSQCKRLAENVSKGAAFHHAGMVSQQRQLVEEAFRKGLIRSVSATPTLAAGVNLPAFRVIMRDLKRYTGRGMEYIPVLEYEQMCLPYNQKILLPNGERRKIGEIVESGENIEVLSYNRGKDKLESKEITDFYSRESSEVLELKTETGSLELTENHPVLTKKDNNEKKWLEAGKLESGDLIKIRPGCVNPENFLFYEMFPKDCYAVDCGKILVKYKEKFGLTDKEIAERLDISSSTVYHYKNDRKAVPLSGILKACEELGMCKKEIAGEINKLKSSYGSTLELPEELTEDFMWLLGLIVTDGNLNRTEDSRSGSSYTSIRVFNTNEEIIDKAKSVFNSLGLECYENNREGVHRLEVGNTLLAQVLNDEFKIPYGRKSKKTKIPEIIFQLPQNLQASFIEGVFDGDGSYYKNEDKYKLRIHFSTSSRKFAEDLRELIGGFGVKSRINSKIIEDMEIDGEKFEVDEKSYFIKIRSKDSINKLSELLDPVKADIESEKYSSYHNSNRHRKEAENYSKILEINQKEKNTVYNIEVEDNHNYIASSREVLHNCGRAGRPKYDDHGEAISVAKNGGMKQEVLEKYVLGEPERIQSKLAAEPILRMHTLSLIASSFCTSMEQLLEFYEKTFYAHQYGSMSEVEDKIQSVVKDLVEYGFLDGEEFRPTDTGKRVSELYIDPESAHLMLESLKKAEEKSTKPVSFLFMLSRTTEMKPNPRVKDKEWGEIEQALMDAEEYLLETVPEEWSTEYEPFMESMKDSLIMQSWISETDEEKLMEKFGVAPGGIRAKMRNADWLLYGAKELARIQDFDVEKDLEKLRLRLKHGIKEELLSLVSYDQIGRVRARKLHDHGIRDQESIREVSFEKLKKLIGKRTAEKLKKQVGQENIFDRENVMDYFE